MTSILDEIRYSREYDGVGDVKNPGDKGPNIDKQGQKKAKTDMKRRVAIITKKIDAEKCTINPYDAIKKLEEYLPKVNSELYVQTVFNSNKHITKINHLTSRVQESIKRFGTKGRISTLGKEVAKNASFLIKMIQDSGHTQNPVMEISKTLKNLRGKIEQTCKKHNIELPPAEKELQIQEESQAYEDIFKQIANDPKYDEHGEYWEYYESDKNPKT